MDIRITPSPNFNAQPEDTPKTLVVIHGTVGSDQGDLSWLCNPESKVSYHYLILRDGTIHRLVEEHHRAWHAGASSWNGQTDGRNSVNGFSIGIALSNYGPRNGNPEPFTDAQYEALADLLHDIFQRRGIRMEQTVGHNQVSPGRKTDPWDHFDWRLVKGLRAERLLEEHGEHTPRVTRGGGKRFPPPRTV